MLAHGGKSYGDTTLNTAVRGTEYMGSQEQGAVGGSLTAAQPHPPAWRFPRIILKPFRKVRTVLDCSLL